MIEGKRERERGEIQMVSLLMSFQVSHCQDWNECPISAGFGLERLGFNYILA